MLKNDSRQRPTVSTLRNLFESYCLILYPSVPETSDDVENIPPYDTWKEWIREDIQDHQNVFADVINWYELNRGTESVLRLTRSIHYSSVLNANEIGMAEEMARKDGESGCGIEMCEKIVDKSPSEERLWRRLREERKKEWEEPILIDAAKRNQVDTVQRLLDAKADIAVTDKWDGRTILHHAVAERAQGRGRAVVGQES